MPKRVMIVDDDDMIREVAEACLELMDWEVLTASSGAEAIKKAEAERPDAIMLDVMMPGMDGPTTLVGLRASEASRDTPVVFLTARVQIDERNRLANLGVHGVLEKPFDPLTLGTQVAGLLGWDAT